MKYHLPYIIFEVTAECNLNCMYCYNIWKIPGHEFKVHEQTYSRTLRVLKRIFRLTDVKHITFTGGEPMLAERFEEIVLFCRLKRKNVTVITNGSAGTEERYDTLIKLGVNLFELPVHAHQPGIHDRITRTEGSWERSVGSIKYLISKGVYVVPVMVITRINIDHIEETLAFIHSLGCRQIMLNRYNIGGEGLRHRDEILTGHEELRGAYKKASMLGNKLGLKLSSNVCTPFCLLNPADYPNISFGSCSSDVERMPISLDIEGNIRLCNHSPVVAGNIFTDPLEKIFHSGHAVNWLKTVPQFCQGCDLYQKCMGGCRAAALQVGLGSDHVDPIMTFEEN